MAAHKDNKTEKGQALTTVASPETLRRLLSSAPSSEMPPTR